MCQTKYKQLTTKEVARAVNVSESSVKRWIDSGQLKASKTPGGHRRIDIADLDRFLLKSGRKVNSPEILGLLSDVDFSDSQSVIEYFGEAIKEGNLSVMRGMVRQLKLTGQNASLVCDNLLAPAYQAVRSKCHHPSEECIVLHRGINLIREVLDAEFNLAAEHSPENKKSVFCADIGYEVDGLPTYLAEASISGLASVTQLGTLVPEEVIIGCIKNHKPDVFWISAAGPIKPKKLAQHIDHAAEVAKKHKVKICLHGRSSEISDLEDAATMTSFSEFTGFIKA